MNSLVSSIMWLTSMHQSMYSTPTPPPPIPGNSGGIDLIISTCIPLPQGGQFLINSTTPMKNICRQSHCPLEIFFGNLTNFHCYCTSPVLIWGNILVNSTTFLCIAAWWGAVFLCVSLAQCVVRMSKSHSTITNPQWRKMNQFSSFSPHFHGPFPGIPGVGGGGHGIHWLVH